MTTVTIEEAQAKLPELIEQATAGEDVVITQDDRPAVRLTTMPATKSAPRFGALRGRLVILSEDDEHLADFKDYMP